MLGQEHRPADNVRGIPASQFIAPESVDGGNRPDVQGDTPGV